MAEQPKQGVRIEVDLDRRINFALQQNDVPPVKRIRIGNNTGKPLADVTVGVSSDPGFAAPLSVSLASIEQGATAAIESVNLILSPAFLQELTERVQGSLTFEVSAAGRSLASSVERVALLARDEWPGFGSLPEILAAFVLPNDPIVAKILKAAGSGLES